MIAVFVNTTAMTFSLDSNQRRALRARAHRLHPVVSISQKGLADTVLAEIEAALLAHELIKVRVYGAERTQREEFLSGICAHCQAQPIQHIGNILILYRPRPDQPAATNGPASRGPRRRTPDYGQRSDRSGPSTRRQRSPHPRPRSGRT